VPSLDAWEKGMKDKVVEFKPALEAPREQHTAQAPAAATS
jgi:hypothetical protein